MTSNYKKIENIITIENTGRKDYTLEVNKMCWYNGPERYDLRYWKDETAGKGVTLADGDWEKLKEAINGSDK